ncbi:MAG: 8-oxo-dGTP diphosphatase [Lachnospiraceae bacterium]|nr:8-oxo-dGTP diphosphatase [Lachnospiraceae bacterium]
MARTENVTITNMCMVFNGSKVLVQDKKDEDYSGITFPGGHVEKGESFTDAVIREVFEETGLKISSPRLCGIKDWMREDGTRYMVLFYKTDKFEGTVTSSDEGEVYWIELEEMKQKKLAYGMDKMLKVFLDENISEYFFYKENGKWTEELK